MRNVFASLIVIGSLVNPASSQDTVAIAKKLQANSVTIHSGRGQGSGVVIKRGDTHYILTAGHVVANLRSEQAIVENGTRKTRIVFDDAMIVTELYEGNETVGQTGLRAEVVRYSNANTAEDLALLRVKKRGILNEGVEFYQGTDTPPVGTRLLHCGSLLGQVGSNSVTNGIVSQLGRVLNNTVYDQSNVGAFPGSSGGGLFLEGNGQYVGMIVRGAGESFNFYVPIRRINTWAKRNGVEFIINPKVEIPTLEKLRSQHIEETAGGNAAQRPDYTDDNGDDQ